MASAAWKELGKRVLGYGWRVAKFGTKAAILSRIFGGGSESDQPSPISIMKTGGGSIGILSGITNMLGSAIGQATGLSKIGSTIHNFLSPIATQSAQPHNADGTAEKAEPSDSSGILSKILSVLIEQSKTQNEILGHASSTSSTISTIVEPTMVAAETLASAAPKILEAETNIAENTDVVATEAKAEIDERNNKLDAFGPSGFKDAIADGVAAAFGGKRGALLNDMLKFAGGALLIGGGGALLGGPGAQIGGRSLGGGGVAFARGELAETLGKLPYEQLAEATAETKHLVKAGLLTEEQAAKLGSRVPLPKLAKALGMTVDDAAWAVTKAGGRVFGVSAGTMMKAGGKIALKGSGKALPVIGYAVDAGIHGYDAWLAQQEGRYAERNRQIAGGAGSIGGGLGGAYAGGALGAPAGPWGVAIGGIAGGILGAFGGEWMLREATDAIQHPDTKEKIMRSTEVIQNIENGEETQKFRQDLSEYENRLRRENEYYTGQVDKVNGSSMSDAEKKQTLARLKNEHDIAVRQLSVQIGATKKAIEGQRKLADEERKNRDRLIDADLWKDRWSREQEFSLHSSGYVKKMALSKGGSMDRGLFYHDDSTWSRGDALWNGKSIRKMKDKSEIDRAWEEFLTFYEEQGEIAMGDHQVERALDAMVSDFAHAMNAIEGKGNNWGGETAREKILWDIANKRLKAKQELREKGQNSGDSSLGPFEIEHSPTEDQPFYSPAFDELFTTDGNDINLQTSIDSNIDNNNEYAALGTNNQPVLAPLETTPVREHVLNNDTITQDDGTMEANEATVQSVALLREIRDGINKINNPEPKFSDYDSLYPGSIEGSIA